MTDEQIRIAIAEDQGQRLFVIRKPLHDPFGYYRPNANGYTSNINEAWKVTADVAAKYVTGPRYEHEPDRVIMEPAPIPDYPNDANAMHAVVETLRKNQFWYAAYFPELFRVVTRCKWEGNIGYFGFDIAQAKPRQHAETFMRVKGLWKE